MKTKDWDPIRSFPVPQNNKLRPCDDGAETGLTAVTSRSEKLGCSSVDQIGAVIRLWRVSLPDDELGGWAVDEAKA